MGAVSGTDIVERSAKTFLERGPALILLFLFPGTVGALIWRAFPASFEIQMAALIATGLFWVGASAISLNILIDSSTKIQLSSMYLTDYKGILWTTAASLLNGLILDVMIFGAASLFLAPFFLGYTNHIYTLLTGSYALTLPEWYVLLIQLQSAALTVYVAARFLISSVFIAVEHKRPWNALKASWQHTAGNVTQLALPTLAAPVSLALAVYAVLNIAPRIAMIVSQLQIHPYLTYTAFGAASAFFAALGTVFTLSILATTYSALK